MTIQEFLLQPLALKGIIKNNIWGKKNDSIIAKYSNIKLVDDFLAELWFGTHKSGIATVKDLNLNLKELLENRTEGILGSRVAKEFGANLPFLFKVLSIEKPLSIQAHPTIALAKGLHKKLPDKYPDEFPKPEIGIALTEVKILYSLKKQSEFVKLFAESENSFVPELMAFGNQSNSILELYKKLLSSSDELISSQCQKLYSRLLDKKNLSEEESFILACKPDFPNGDIGIFCFYLMNLLTLKPLDALFIDSNVPHAYLNGELMECMAPSDNVVRAGLTPKFKDKETLVKMLDSGFNESEIETPDAQKQLFEYRLLNKDYFNISIISLSNKQEIDVELKDSFEFIFCFNGSGVLISDGKCQALSQGSAYLIPAALQKFKIKSETSIKIIKVNYPN